MTLIILLDLKTNIKQAILNLFSNKSIRDLITNDRFSVFKVQYQKALLKIKSQTGKIMTNKDILIAEIEKHMILLVGI